MLKNPRGCDRGYLLGICIPCLHAQGILRMFSRNSRNVLAWKPVRKSAPEAGKKWRGYTQPHCRSKTSSTIVHVHASMNLKVRMPMPFPKHCKGAWRTGGTTTVFATALSWRKPQVELHFNWESFYGKKNPFFMELNVKSHPRSLKILQEIKRSILFIGELKASSSLLLIFQQQPEMPQLRCFRCPSVLTSSVL